MPEAATLPHEQRRHWFEFTAPVKRATRLSNECAADEELVITVHVRFDKFALDPRNRLLDARGARMRARTCRELRLGNPVVNPLGIDVSKE